MILFHSGPPYRDIFSLGNFADKVKRAWASFGVYLDYPAPDSPNFATDPRSLGPKRWRLRDHHNLIVAELTGWIDPSAKRGSPKTFEYAWMAVDISEALPAETPIPEVMHLSTGFIGSGISARKIKPFATSSTLRSTTPCGVATREGLVVPNGEDTVNDGNGSIEPDQRNPDREDTRLFPVADDVAGLGWVQHLEQGVN